MATMIICDGGCGAQSPNAEGRFVANNWLKITTTRLDHLTKHYILCEDCERRVMRTMTASGDQQ